MWHVVVDGTNMWCMVSAPPNCHPQTATTKLPPPNCHHQTATTKLPPPNCHRQFGGGSFGVSANCKNTAIWSSFFLIFVSQGPIVSSNKESQGDTQCMPYMYILYKTRYKSPLPNNPLYENQKESPCAQCLLTAREPISGQPDNKSC